MLGLKRKPKVKNVATNPRKTIPKDMMPDQNRQQRRSQAAFTRTTKSRERAYKARVHSDKVAESRREGLEGRMEKVRAATKARKGRVNNPRFR